MLFQPFITAPKDGSSILALEADGDLIQLYWDEEDNIWCDHWHREHPAPHILSGWAPLPHGEVQ